MLIGTITLILTLFVSAVGMQAEQLKEYWGATFAVLGPGTLLTALATAALAWGPLALDVVSALLLSAVLATTDPVLLRDVLRDARTPQPVRQILSVGVRLQRRMGGVARAASARPASAARARAPGVTCSIQMPPLRKAL